MYYTTNYMTLREAMRINAKTIRELAKQYMNERIVVCLVLEKSTESCSIIVPAYKRWKPG